LKLYVTLKIALHNIYKKNTNKYNIIYFVTSFILFIILNCIWWKKFTGILHEHHVNVFPCAVQFSCGIYVISVISCEFNYRSWVNCPLENPCKFYVAYLHGNDVNFTDCFRRIVYPLIAEKDFLIYKSN